MKKLLLLFIVFVSVFLFVACESGAFVSEEPVDEIAVHNGLVDRMDAILQTEEGFYDLYFALLDGDDSSDLRFAYDQFVLNVDAVDDYFTNIKFGPSQQVFVQEYNDYYKPFLTDYVSYAGDFLASLESEGVTADVISSFQADLDTYTIDFIDVHNRLIETINLQSDFDSNVDLGVDETIY
jgi:hypothetical protein